MVEPVVDVRVDDAEDATPLRVDQKNDVEEKDEDDEDAALAVVAAVAPLDDEEVTAFESPCGLESDC